MSVSEQQAIAILWVYIGLLCTGFIGILSVAFATVLLWALTSRILHRLNRPRLPKAAGNASPAARRSSPPVPTGRDSEQSEITSCNTQSPWR